MGDKSFLKSLGLAGVQGTKMANREKESVRRDIAEAFSFARFIIDNPKFTHKIKNNAEINILSCRVGAGTQKLRCFHKNSQAFVSQPIFRPL